MSKKAYIGVPTYVISDNGETVELTGNNISDYFTVICDNCTYEFYQEDMDTYWVFYIQKTNVNAPATFTLCPLYNINNIEFSYASRTDEGFSGISVKHYSDDGVKVLLNAANDSFFGIVQSNNLISANDTIVFEFNTNDSSAIECYIDSITFTVLELINKGDCARFVSDIYIGVPTEFPIYESEVVNKTIDQNSIDTYFTIDNGEDYKFAWNGEMLQSTNQRVRNSSATITLTANIDIVNMVFDWSVSSRLNEGVFQIIINKNGESSIVESASGEDNGTYTCSLQTGDFITFVYQKSAYFFHQGSDSGSISNISIYINSLTQVGVETKEVARKVVAAYFGDIDGVAQQYYFVPTYLKDFVYINNYNGTYTLTEWKGTLNGEPSTELIIPDSNSIIL